MSCTYYVNQFLNITADTFARLFSDKLLCISDLASESYQKLSRQIVDLSIEIAKQESSYDADCLEQWIDDTEYKLKDIQTKYTDYCERMLQLHNNENSAEIHAKEAIVDENVAKLLSICKECTEMIHTATNYDTIIEYVDNINEIVSEKLYPNIGDSTEVSRLNYNEAFVTRLDLYNNVDYIKYCYQETINKSRDKLNELLSDVANCKQLTLRSSIRELVDAYFIEKFDLYDRMRIFRNILHGTMHSSDFICVICSEELTNMYNVWAKDANVPIQELTRVDYYAAAILGQATQSDDYVSSFKYQITDPLSHRCIKDLIVIKIHYNENDKQYSFVNTDA